MSRNTYYALARHCGAVLLGRKPAGLFTFAGGQEELREMVVLAAEYGLRTLVLRKHGGRVLLFIYHKTRLTSALSQPEAHQTLTALGFPQNAPLTRTLLHLRGRFGAGEDFPHEIGFFLGYPTDDVIGFLTHRGRNFKHCCMWKVYGDVAAALQLCREYESCRALCCGYVEQSGCLPPPELCRRQAAV